MLILKNLLLSSKNLTIGTITPMHSITITQSTSPSPNYPQPRKSKLLISSYFQFFAFHPQLWKATKVKKVNKKLLPWWSHVTKSQRRKNSRRWWSQEVWYKMPPLMLNSCGISCSLTLIWLLWLKVCSCSQTFRKRKSTNNSLSFLKTS